MLAWLEAHPADVDLVDEHHFTQAEHPAITVVQAIQGGVVLVVRTQCLQDQVRLVTTRQHLGIHQLLRQLARAEARLACGRAPGTVGGIVTQVEAARVLQALVEIGKAGDHIGNHAADTAVVGNCVFPVDRLLAQGRLGHAGDDPRLRAQVWRARAQLAVGDVHHAEGVLHGHALRPAGLHVDFGTAQARQDQRIAAGDQVRAVELGGNLHGQCAIAHGRMSARRIRRSLGKVATQADEHLGTPLLHGLDRQHRVVPVCTRHAEPEALFDGIEQRRPGLLVDAHGAVALHVAVATHR